jgi:hypothetical protein
LMGRARIVACLGVVLLLASMNGQPSYAQAAGDERRPRLELGIGGWVSWGETKWAHDASMIPGLGNPTSKLTYKDHGTNILEVTGRLWLPQRFFGRLNVGGAAIGGGRLTDDDYLTPDGGAPSSRTTSDVTGSSLWYLNADLGRRVAEFPHGRGWLDIFAGYQYYFQRHTANGISQVSCTNSGQTVDLDPGQPGTQPLCSPTASLSNSVNVITNTTHWHSIRVGGSAEYRLTRRFSVLGTVAFIPVSILDNKDVHHLRSDLKQNPSISMLGYGMGADADVGLRFMIVRNLYANVGYRVWWNRMIDGTITFHNASVGSDEFPLTEFQSFRHGITFGLNYSF